MFLIRISSSWEVWQYLISNNWLHSTIVHSALLYELNSLCSCRLISVQNGKVIVNCGRPFGGYHSPWDTENSHNKCGNIAGDTGDFWNLYLPYSSQECFHYGYLLGVSHCSVGWMYLHVQNGKLLLHILLIINLKLELWCTAGNMLPRENVCAFYV